MVSPLGNLINGACGWTTGTTLLENAILLPIMTPQKGYDVVLNGCVVSYWIEMY